MTHAYDRDRRAILGVRSGVMGRGAKGDISRRLTAARERLGWSREVLAYHSGVSWSAITQIESGRRPNPRPDTLVALARALEVTVGYLVGEDRPQTLLAHRAALYGSDQDYVGTIVPFVSEGLERSEPVLVVTSAANLRLLQAEVSSSDGNVTFEDSRDWLVSPLAAVAGFRVFTNEAIERGAPWARIVAEPIWRSTSARDVKPWATLESMLNLIFEATPLTVVCPYDIRASAPSIIRVARRTHPYLTEGTRLQRNEDYVDPGEFVLGR